jgi:cobyrinic acid a,c-diamide synthase
MDTHLPRLVIAGTSGDSGKTVVTLGLVTALRKRGFSVAVFKKGPDYIDSAWLSAVAAVPCRNLDTYLVDPDRTAKTFGLRARGSDIAVIEGNRGLYDGLDDGGSHSTAALAKLLAAPVILVVSAAKTTRTLAAVIHGCRAFDPGVNIAGVILNRISGPRHARVITDAIRASSDTPVLGLVPNMDEEAPIVPGRHLGLVTPAEFPFDAKLSERLEQIGNHLDVDRLIAIAERASDLDIPGRTAERRTGGAVRIGYFRDSCFTFYYPENLEALERRGAELLPVSSLEDPSLPRVDALYIGGGFPETHAERLCRNRPMMDSVRKAAEKGLPVYAECGGLVYLARSLTIDHRSYRMAGLFPVDLVMHSRPVGHGYAVVRIDRKNPFFGVGTRVKGHEFHYTGPSSDLDGVPSCMRVERGTGLGGERDGLLFRNTMACYTHIHAEGVRSWAPSLVSCARNCAEHHRSLEGAQKRDPMWKRRTTSRKKTSRTSGMLPGKHPGID